MSERKRLIFTAIAVSLVAIVTGLFLGGDLLPSHAVNQQYDERTTTTTTKVVVSHSHDGISQHEHTVTTVVTTTETTSHGYFHDFAATIAPTTPTPAPTPEPAPVPALAPTPAPEPPPAQQGPITPEITPAPIPIPIPTRGANEVWMYNLEFKPASITVPVGTTVIWINKDGEMHAAKSDDGLFDKIVLPGGSFSYTFTEPGIFSYYCEPHMHHGMAGTVIVR